MGGSRVPEKQTGGRAHEASRTHAGNEGNDGALRPNPVQVLGVAEYPPGAVAAGDEDVQLGCILPGGAVSPGQPTDVVWTTRSSGSGVSWTRRSSWALRATTMVEADISTAPMAGLRVIPAQANTPAARGMAMML
jgi:hypothetical protein